jgi:hypothetical protein
MPPARAATSRLFLVAVLAGISSLAASRASTATVDPLEYDLHILLMTYKRTTSVAAVIKQLRDQALDTSRIRLVVSQNGARKDEHVASLGTLLDSHRPAFGIIEHVLTPMLHREADSGYGSKRNALNNLLHGLRTGFRDSGAVNPDGGVPHLIVLEDDVVLSPDALAFFSFAASHMRVQQGESRRGHRTEV